MHSIWLTTELLHPLNKGGRIRTYNLLKELKRLQTITYLALEEADGSDPAQALAKAGEYCDTIESVAHPLPAKRSASFYAKLAANLASPLPYSVAQFRSATLRKRAYRALASDRDALVVVDFVHAAVNLPDASPHARVLFQHNVEAMIWDRQAEAQTDPVWRRYFRLQADRMRRFEAQTCARFDCVIAVSEADAQYMRERYGLKHVRAIPTSVDTNYFEFAPLAADSPPSIVFVGSMDWSPNEDGVLWFASQVLPLIHAAHPDATFTVVGRSPGPRIRELAQHDIRIRVTGRVDDVRPYLRSATCSVVPLHVGGGTRIKIYESISAGTPVVSTTIGAEGLPLDHDRHVLIADDARGFAELVLRMLCPNGERDRLAHSGAEFVRARFGTAAVAREFDAICREAVAY